MLGTVPQPQDSHHVLIYLFPLQSPFQIGLTDDCRRGSPHLELLSQCWFLPGQRLPCVRGLFSAKVPKSSFAEVRMGLLIEPTHMVEKDEEQENEKENERDGGKAKGRVVENQATQNIQMTREMKCADNQTLSQCHLRHWNECAQTREKCNVWGCSVHTTRRLQQIVISCKRSDYNKYFFLKKKSRQKFHSEFLDEWASKASLPVLWGCTLHELRSHWQSLINELHQYIPQSWILSSNKRMLLACGICQNEDLKSAVFVGRSHNPLKIFPQ